MYSLWAFSHSNVPLFHTPALLSGLNRQELKREEAQPFFFHTVIQIINPLKKKKKHLRHFSGQVSVVVCCCGWWYCNDLNSPRLKMKTSQSAAAYKGHYSVSALQRLFSEKKGIRLYPLLAILDSGYYPWNSPPQKWCFRFQRGADIISKVQWPDLETVQH